MQAKKTEKMKKTGKFLKEFFGAPVRWYDWLILAALCAFCFFSYEMRDLFHTAGCSFGFLDGHFADFYDYLAESGIGEDGSTGLHASYMPTVYLIFAVWNLPLKLFGIVPKATAELGFAAVMWAKLLPCLVYIAGGVIVFKIAELLKMAERKSRIVFYAYLSMPVALYGQFILGQYESLLVFCVLMGVYCWLRKKTLPFVIWFSVAVTFKYTALLFFIPLVLLREKNVWRILLLLAGAMALFILEYAAFMHSAAFKMYAFGVGAAGDNPTGYITNAAYFTGFDLGGNLKYYVYLTFLAFAFVCAYAYFKHTETPDEEHRYALYLLCLSAAALFCFSKWHPHWLMIAVPFWTLTAFMHRDTKIFMVLDLLFMALFVLFCTNQFASVCDEVMLNKGIFKFIMPGGKVGNASAMSEYTGMLDMSWELSLITAIMGVYAVFKHPRFMEEDPNRAADASMGWIRARYIIGLLIFIVPSMMVLHGTLNGPQAVYEEDRRELFVTFKEGECVTQPFTAGGTELKKLKFPASRGAAFSTGDLSVKITDQDDRLLYETVCRIDSMTEGGFVTLKPGIKTEPGKTYRISFTVPGADTDRSFALLGTVLDSPYAHAETDGKDVDYHLNMFVYQ